MATVLLDTNILIYHMNAQGGEEFAAKFREALRAGAGISVISRIEVLGWRGHTAETTSAAMALLSLCSEYSLAEPVVQRCIRLRQSHNVKLPDAIIAATALTWGLPVMTRNTVDFQRIPGLGLINPFTA
jgi:predicted nucleic acid-binding protein